MVDSGAQKKKKKGLGRARFNLLDFAIQMAIGEGGCWDCVYNSAEKPIPIGTVKKRRDMGGLDCPFGEKYCTTPVSDFKGLPIYYL